MFISEVNRTDHVKQNVGNTSINCVVLAKLTLCVSFMLYYGIDKLCIENLTRLEVAVSCQ